MQVRVSRWDPSKMKPHRIVLVIGKRGSGKSIILRDLMYHRSAAVDFGVAMSPTEEAIQSFRQCMPDAWIYRNFQQEKIEDLVRVQRKCIQEKKGAKDMFLILDDCMYDKKALKTTSMRELFMNGRHLHVSMYFAVQYLMDLAPDLRSNVDYVIATREKSS